MGIQCNKCGSRNTTVVKAKDLADKTGDKSIMTAASGTVSTAILAELLELLLKVIGKIFGWLEEKEKNDRKVVVCKECGYWERV
jgi:hypothetical protein